VLPDIHRPILSQPLCPYEDFSPRALASRDARPPLMGFFAALDESIAAIAL
jgi:hypothetical protein